MPDNAHLLAVLTPMIATDEGVRLTAYQDTRGLWTIGYGRCDPGVRPGMTCTLAEAEAWRDDHLLDVLGDLDRLIPWWRSLSIPRQAVLGDMAFQLGAHGLCEFVNMLAACEHADWPSASRQMLNSRWAIQTPKRAARLANIMITGEIQP